MFSSVNEVKLLSKLVWVHGAYQYAKERFEESGDETSIWKTAEASIFQHGLGVAFFEARAAEMAHRGYAVLTGFGTFAQALRDILQSAHYPDSLHQQSIGDSSEFMPSAFQRESELRVEENGVL